MSQTARSSAVVLLALVLALMALAAVLVPQGSDDARRKITLGQNPSVSQTVDAVATPTV